MKELRDNWNLRINGFWNVGIFSIGWLGKHIFDSNEIMLDVGLAARLPQRFTADNVTLIPSNNNLILVPSDFENTTLVHMEEMAYKLLNILMHTPISAVGFNFGYELDDSDPDILDMLPLLLKDKFSAKDLIVSSRTFSWSFDRGDHILNLSCIINNNSPHITLNFHKDVKDANTAKNFIKDKIILFKEYSSTIIKDIFMSTIDVS